MRDDGCGSGAGGASLLLRLSVDGMLCIFQPFIDSKYLPIPSSFTQQMLIELLLSARPTLLGAWDAAVSETWSPAPLRSFEKHFFLFEAFVSISSDSLYNPVSPMRASLLFPFDGWARGGREGFSNLLKGKLDRTSIRSCLVLC